MKNLITMLTVILVIQGCSKAPGHAITEVVAPVIDSTYLRLAEAVKQETERAPAERM